MLKRTGTSAGEGDDFVAAAGGADECVRRGATTIYRVVKIINYTNAREGCSIPRTVGRECRARRGLVRHAFGVPALRGESEMLSEPRPFTSVESHFRRRTSPAAALPARALKRVGASKRPT